MTDLIVLAVPRTRRYSPRPDGKKEVIDFRLAKSESAAEWERFFTDLYRRGLTGEGIEMVCVEQAERHQHGPPEGARPGLAGEHHAVKHQHPVMVVE